MNIKEGVQKVVNEIFLEKGEVRPSDLVEHAKSKDSPAHDGFIWDNRKAGHEYRLMQARQWIRKVEIIIENAPVRLVHVPIIEQDDGEGYYKPVTLVCADPEEFKAAKQECLGKLNAARQSFEELTKVKGAKVDAHKARDGFEMVKSAIV